MSKQPWSNLAVVGKVSKDSTARVFFSALAEAAAAKIRTRYNDEVKDGSLKEHPKEVEPWASEQAIEETEAVVKNLDTEALLTALEGEIADRELEVVGQQSKQLSKDLVMELQIALRNEAMYRLHQRGEIPDGAWRAQRFSRPG